VNLLLDTNVRSEVQRPARFRQADPSYAPFGVRMFNPWDG
jgi:hypothetical protein